MCDLWRNTAPAPAGSVPRQIEYALSRLPAASGLKLYNAGSFFDLGAIPQSDWRDIITLCLPFEQLIVECHPRLVGPNILAFAEMFEGQLEVAMGLETAHPAALEKLNKRITVQDFTRAAQWLCRNRITVRTFLLAGVPFIPQAEQQRWMRHSLNTALDAGTSVVSLIPTRAGNGALDALELSGDFHEPALRDLEDAHDFGIHAGRARVFADTWDLERFSCCPLCAEARHDRLERMNLSQNIEPRIRCACEN
jgi:radical SAM enzyme (TIGR01210 family)